MATPLSAQTIAEIQRKKSIGGKESPSKMTSPGALCQLDQAMTKIKSIVQERMMPPYENPNELAKWIQNHIGIDNIRLTRSVRRHMRI